MGDGDEQSKELRRSENAEARMKFALVWSPRHGLTLRCADFSFTGKGKLLSPNFFHHTGQNNNMEAGCRVDVELRTQDRTDDEVNLAWIGASVEDVKPEIEEMDADNKVENKDDSEEAETRVGSCKRCLDSPRGESEALLANEQLDNTDNRALDAERLEATDENNLATLASKALVEEETAAKAKGKEKALSDGSVESCNSAGLLSRGKKRPGFEQQQLILGSKRLKTSQECLGSTSKLKQDSSFMNWISNMTKGIWKGNENANGQVNAIVDQQEMITCCLKENSGCRNTGFQTFFQSIYCLKKRDEDAVEMDSTNVASLQELTWIPEQCLNTKGDHLSSSGNDTFSSEKKHEVKEPNTSGLESLWISRFSSKSSFPQKEDLHERITNDSSLDAAKARDSSQKAILPIVSSLRIESSEAMASLFARRLEAMKHILPTEEGHTNTICFYCGKKGHRLQNCLEVTDTELRDLIQNISASNGREGASSLCIRCFQLSHWAVTCPNAPPYNSGAEDRAMKHSLASTSGTKLPFSGFTDIPKAVFDAVQVLRLTRTDVLKWINSKKAVSGLEGFFLRLRLGKWEEGLGGTGYHVARIEDATEGQSSKKHPVNSSVSVKVGGMTCFVESQFISNHNFLEEELKAWWQSSGKGAGRSGRDGIPSAEELSRKIQQRKMLSF